MDPQRGALRRRADTIASHLASLPSVEGIVLFGSIARGAPSKWSDIDLLVVGSDPGLGPTGLLRTIPESLREERLSLLSYSRAELEELFASGSSFSAHLRREAAVLYDEHRTLVRLLGDEAEVRPNIEEELDAELARLSVYDDLRIFKDNFLFVLTQLYTTGKAIVMLGLASKGEGEYDREAAFESFKHRHQAVASDVDAIASLRPFYRLVTRRGDEQLPFPYRGAAAETRDAIASIRRLADAVKSS